LSRLVRLKFGLESVLARAAVERTKAERVRHGR
jgi:hypothetical protein